MTEIYLCDGDVHERLDGILKSKLKSPFEIRKTPLGKPYIGGNPFYFSLSHSSDRSIIAISDKPCGVDLEVFRGRLRESILKTFTERERAEIASEREFLLHWTVREAYVKLYGLSVFKLLRRLEFYGGKLYLDGQLQPVKFRTYDFQFGVAATCLEE